MSYILYFFIAFVNIFYIHISILYQTNFSILPNYFISFPLHPQPSNFPTKSTHPTTLQSKHVLIDNHSQNNLNLLISRPKLELPSKCIKSHFIYPHNPLHLGSSQIINYPSKSRNSDITYQPKIVLYRTISLKHTNLYIIHILRTIKSPYFLHM